MIYNAQRLKANFETEKFDSNCPMCNNNLIAKLGDIKVWHWAHYPSKNKNEYCKNYKESDWHLQMKQNYEHYGWRIEYPININEKKYILDACKIINNIPIKIREFVHSLSPYYIQKHNDIKNYLIKDILWYWDGNQFSSERKYEIKNNGIKNLLTPRAYSIFKQIGGLVNYNNKMYHHWTNNIFYLNKGICRHEHYTVN